MTGGGDDGTTVGTPVERAKVIPATLGAGDGVPSRRSRSATAPVVTITPSHVNLVDGHTDYNGGLRLLMAADRHVTVAARPRSDDLPRTRVADLDKTVELAPDDDPKSQAVCVTVIARVLREEDPIGGADLVIASDVPMGAGLSSSVAFEPVVGRALLTISDHDLPAADLALACWRAERKNIGVECDTLDQFSATLYEAGSVLSLGCRNHETKLVPLGDGVGVLVIDTGVSHELTESGCSDYVRKCAAALGTLRGDADRDLGSLYDVDRDPLGAHTDALDPIHFRHARRVVTENERVCCARDALAADNLDRVGDAMFTAHDSLRDDYEVSCPELDVAVELVAETPGVYGARMTGGGFGGSAVALVDDDAFDRVGRAIRDAAPERIDPDADVFACHLSADV